LIRYTNWQYYCSAIRNVFSFCISVLLEAGMEVNMMSLWS